MASSRAERQQPVNSGQQQDKASRAQQDRANKDRDLNRPRRAAGAERPGRPARSKWKSQQDSSQARVNRAVKAGDAQIGMQRRRWR